MNLVQLSKEIEKISLKNSMVKHFSVGDIYENWNTTYTEMKYSAINIDYSSVTRYDGYNTVEAIMYYADRLMTNKKNLLNIEAESVNVIQSIINAIDENIGQVEDNYNIQFFEQKFLDDLAGAFVTVRIDVPSDLGECSITEYDMNKEAFNTIEKLKDYLYTINYDSIDYNKGYEYFNNRFKPVNFGCSAARNGQYHYRNYDWYYNENAEFVIKINGNDNRYSSIGVAGNVIKDKDVFKYNEAYSYLPFYTMDGINSEGLCCNINVTEKRGELKQNKVGKQDICGFMVVRYCLDHYKSAEEAVNGIKNELNVWLPESFENGVQFLISDSEDTYVVEFINNNTLVKRLDERPFITNFNVLDEDGELIDTINNEIDYTEIAEYGQGVERYNLLLNEEINDELFREGLKYTKAYTEDEWLTEFTGNYKTFGKLTVQDAFERPEKFLDIMEYTKDLYDNRNRETAETWQTCHSVKYNIQDKEMTIVSQEDNENEYHFSL